MKALLFDRFGGPLRLAEVPEPALPEDGVVVRVEATGICRSDWHAWQGHDPDIRVLPHVPGHELAGIIERVGSDVENWQPGARVTVPFVCACGQCPDCVEGNLQVCPHQYQPGFTGWGSFAERVALPRADVNLVAVPAGMSAVAAASLGCRFATAYRAIADQGKARVGEWVAVHGCGGLGLACIMIAKALGARPIAIDLRAEALALAAEMGAEVVIDSKEKSDVPAAVREIVPRGADLSLDAFGSRETVSNSLRCLRSRGRHVQIGLLLGKEASPPLPMGEVIARELVILGSHGMGATDYPRLLDWVARGVLDPAKLVRKIVSLEEGIAELEGLGNRVGGGVTVLDCTL